jgi:hypothetical protein
MRRRHALTTLAAGVVSLGGCIGGGSEVVTTVQRSISVSPGQGWIERIPDTSGGAVQYKARTSKPFEVFLFTSEEAYMFYDTYIDGGDPARTPGGHDEISTRAEQVTDTTYEAATPNGGARESIGTSGPYFFVVDHSNYLDGPGPEDNPSPLSVFLDLTVTERNFP